MSLMGIHASQTQFCPTCRSRRDRHAKTLDIAQEEVLTCLGIHIYDRLHRIWQKLKEEEQTWQILFYLGVDALKKSFEVRANSSINCLFELPVSRIILPHICLVLCTLLKVTFSKCPFVCCLSGIMHSLLKSCSLPCLLWKYVFVQHCSLNS